MSHAKLDLGQIRPQGWLLELLQRQANGLTGHIAESGYPFDTCLWAGEKMEASPAARGSPTAWWPYEQTAYYLDGAVRLAHLLGADTEAGAKLLDLVRANHAWVKSHVRADGRFGTVLTERWRHWPYASFARSVMAEYEATGDPSLVELLHRHYLTFEAADFADVLELANVEALLWVHGHTGDARLLALAEEAYRLFRATPAYREWFGCDLDFASDQPPTTHGVVYLELLKIPALLYAATGHQEYLDHALNGTKTMEANSLLVSGLPSSTEHFEGRDEACGHETCNTAVLPYTYGALLRVTGDPVFADRIERAVFNAGLGSVSKDFATHQYFSAPNQPVVGPTSNPYGHHPARMAYQKAHDVQCCTGNVNRFVPYFTELLWMLERPPGGQTSLATLTAALYAPCEVTAEVAPGVVVTLTEATNYPFGDTVTFTLRLPRPTRFRLQLRIPGWCTGATVAVGGSTVAGPGSTTLPTPGSFFSLEREFAEGDIVTLTLPRVVTTSNWPNGGTAFEYGPLVFSLPVGEGAAWNWALSGTGARPVEGPHIGFPWDPAHTPLRLHVRFRRLPAWKLLTRLDKRHGKKVTVCPGFPKNRRTAGPETELELLPYGCTTARITVFP